VRDAEGQRLLQRVPAPVLDVMRVLEANGHHAHLVGGGVRDLLQGKPASDFDVATDARPERVMALFEHTIPTGVRHGTVTVRMGGMAMEVTTYRVDLGYSDGRRPDAVRFADRIEDDLARRDFTINAMALDLRGVITDPFGGREDLRRGLIRAVGEPGARFAEDGLRILRALRFAAQLGFDIEKDTLDGMNRHADRLRAVSLERVGGEWLRIARGHWERIAQLLAGGPWLDVWPPLLSRWRHAFDKGPFDAGPWPTLKKLWSRQDDGLGAAFSIAIWCTGAGLSAEEIRQLAHRLAWGRDLTRLVSAVSAAYAEAPASWSVSEWRRALWRYGALPVQMASALADGWDQRRSLPLYRRSRRAVRAQPIWSLRDLAVRGNDLVPGRAGPEIGRTLQWLADEVLEGRLPNRRDALLAALQARDAAPSGPGTASCTDSTNGLPCDS
jgi:tRNA nucleotidyltransferase (CCA-adding enzyme)